MGHKKSNARHGVPLYELLIREVPEVCKTAQGFVLALVIVNHHNYTVRLQI